MTSQPRPSSVAEIVFDALPAPGLLAFAIEVQARARKRLTRRQVMDALLQLEADNRVVRRPPFDFGRPDRWGRA